LCDFEAAARHLHFGEVTDELHLTHCTISRKVRLLEQALRIQFLERRYRAVFLTEAGMSRAQLVALSALSGIK
jgi:DNA-binding transcriptional LysR family regulator